MILTTGFDINKSELTKEDDSTNELTELELQ